MPDPSLHGHPYPRLAYAASEEAICWHDVAALKARGHLAECRIARLASVIGMMAPVTSPRTEERP